jgi:hypothetical protein
VFAVLIIAIHETTAIGSGENGIGSIYVSVQVTDAK